MMWIISKEKIAFCSAGRKNARKDCCNVTHHITIPMQAGTQWTHSEVWSQLATTPECSFEIGDRQCEKKQWNCHQRAICNVTRGIDAGRGVIPYRGVYDGSDAARPLWRSPSARTEMFFADDKVLLSLSISQWDGYEVTTSTVDAK